PARLARYTANMRVLYDGAISLGLTPCLPREAQGPVVVNIHAPADPAWNLQAFVDALKTRGVLISNFYNTPSPSFRVGCIGAITPTDMAHAVAAMGAALKELGIQRREAA
ncbi:MAG TPA: 2-aminoethylphosphonate--pyruvate aminotransferase, partial [Acetobacteraceae bacterium]|nr:2-aminoethylphosphonate--pyruvate aminotransferase [Acetobacteraceae bacterium]